MVMLKSQFTEVLKSITIYCTSFRVHWYHYDYLMSLHVSNYGKPFLYCQTCSMFYIIFADPHFCMKRVLNTVMTKYNFKTEYVTRILKKNISVTLLITLHETRPKTSIYISLVYNKVCSAF